VSVFYATAYEAILIASPIVAARKNLTLTPDWHEALARLAFDNLSDLELHQFLRSEKSAVGLTVHTLSQFMDILVMGHLSVLHAQAKGREIPDMAQLFTRVERVMAGLIANDENEPTLFIYPDSEVLMAVPFDATRVRELNINLPKASRRASFKIIAQPR
jgi:hypothetical protein